MNLQEILSLSHNAERNKIGISEERIKKIIPVARQYIAFWREYPDLFVDFLQTGGKPDVTPTFKFYFYHTHLLLFCELVATTFCFFILFSLPII